MGKRDANAFRERFNRWKNGELVYDKGRPIDVLLADKSDANFMERIKAPMREYISTWEDPYHSISSHKMSYSSYDEGDLVYPMIYKDKDGKLKDWTDPLRNGIGPMEWNRDKIFDAAERSAIQRGDTLWLPKGKGEHFTTNYKKYYPGFKNGKDGSEIVKHGNFTGRLMSAIIGQQKHKLLLEKSNYENKQQKIASTKDYGWKGDSRGWMNKQKSHDYIDPAWRLSDVPIFGLLHNWANQNATKDASPTELAYYNRHIGYDRDMKYMPYTNILFSGDFTKDGNLKRPNAEYTGLSKSTKDNIRSKIGNKIKVKDDGSWTPYEVGKTKGIFGGDIAPELKNFSIRENNQSGIYDVFDTYDFDFWHKMNPIKNRTDGLLIEVRDTIWGQNANPDLYNPMFTKVGYKYGKDSGIYIKPSHRGRLTALKKRTGKSEAELYRTGGPAVRKMVTFARNARKWRKG